MTEENNQDQDKSNKTNKTIKKPEEIVYPNEELKKMKKVKGWIGHIFVESILLDSNPLFLGYDKRTKEIKIFSNIVANGIEHIPLQKEDCGYTPYSFSKDELKELLSTEITKENLLDEIKDIVETYLQASDEIKYLCIGDLLLTYCQEWVDTIHFPFFVGETESGKSTAAYLFKILAYRCLYGANIPTADIYNFLGMDEEAAGTIVEDEAQEIGYDRRKIRLYKNSYAKGSVQPIIDMKSGRKQIFYKTFCFKAFAGERLPDDRGFTERLAICFMAQGKPKKNIKKASDAERKPLERLRNKLLAWKIKNIENSFQFMQSGLEQRDQELWEDYLRVVTGTKYEQQGRQVISYFLKQRHEKIWDSLEARIFRVLVKHLTPKYELYIEKFWQEITVISSEIPGELERDTYIEYESGQRLTRNYLSKLFEEKFQGKKDSRLEYDEMKRPHKITYYIFDKKTLSNLAKKYNVEFEAN